MEATFPSRDFTNLENLVLEFLSQVDTHVESASFGVAGPVVDRRAAITKLLWVIDERQLEEGLGISPVHLLNNLEAIAYAVPFLESRDLYTLNEGNQIQSLPWAGSISRIIRNAQCFTVCSSVILSHSLWNMRIDLRDTMVTCGLLFRK